MKASDEKLRESLREAMRLDQERLEEEMKNCEPHVFSEEFERQMEEMMQVQKRKSRFGSHLRYIAAAVVVLLLTGGILFIGSEDLHASELQIDIREWLDNFFTVEDGKRGRKETDTLFAESQIGYMTEGFEKSGELVTYTDVQYEYRNETGNYIFVQASRDMNLQQIDNEEAVIEVHVNASGYEYSLAYRENSDEKILLWKADNDIFYKIAGKVDVEELIKIMDSVSY